MAMPILAFMTLTAGVAGNVFLLQSAGSADDTASTPQASWNLAAIGGGEFGDTGSIGAGGFELAALAPPDAQDHASPAEVTRAIQRELQIRGYETGESDGALGLMTRAAIMAFEHDNGLPATGRPSQDLLKSILLGVNGKTADKGQKPTREAQDVIRSVQRSLTSLGYAPGETSGMMTSQTEKAIRAFEADQALPESGRVSGPLVARLGRLAGA
jgi:peptidoglycan hydrolase-like protein with peptidoglycan-binding domain